MKDYFRDLFKYMDWANQRYLVTLEDNEVKDDHILKLYSHLISAQIIWLNRIRELPTSPFPVWEQYKLSELNTMAMESTTNWLNYLDHHKFPTFKEMIFYKNSQGDKFERTIQEIITHVNNHSTYHRGQLAIALKEKGIQPPVTDYTVYCRQK